jgi:hypothetical protein
MHSFVLGLKIGPSHTTLKKTTMVQSFVQFYHQPLILRGGQRLGQKIIPKAQIGPSDDRR